MNGRDREALPGSPRVAGMSTALPPAIQIHAGESAGNIVCTGWSVCGQRGGEDVKFCSKPTGSSLLRYRCCKRPQKIRHCPGELLRKHHGATGGTGQG